MAHSQYFWMGNHCLFVLYKLDVIAYYRQNLYETMFCFEDIDESGETYMDEIINEDAYEVAVRTFASYDNYKKYYEKAFKAKE